MSRRPFAIAIATAASLGFGLPGAASAQEVPAPPCVDAGLVVVGCTPPPPPPPPAPAASGNPCDDGALRPTPGNVERVRQATHCLLNVERTKRGARALRLDGSLDKAAARFSRQMVRQGFFDHRSPGGSTLGSRVKQTSYLQGARSWSLGENIAYGTGSLSTPAATVRSWMNSPGHRANILNRSFSEIGVGVAAGAPVRLRASETAATYTTNFGRRGR